ncbi:carboxypeptidase [Trichophyton equinum CBS 127.97]|uniref:Carboxypeptidase n=1 Tax=Trichophyton equinum (strain ATCC MYA-4606 / CBS 127.97) TaxID=559882 RepID=F2Q5X8_TRIEC|nr:carboxypeptidase [Trichophyton equinum CBS 127.97]
MKFLTTGLLATAALAAAQEQQVLQAEDGMGQAPQRGSSIFDETLQKFQSSLEDGISHFCHITASSPACSRKIPVLIYAGDADFICNWLGNQAWTDALEWPGHKKFAEAKLEDLKIVDNKNKGKKIGQVKSSGNFTFMRIFGAGHMVPLNQPEASLEFLNRWLRGEWH